MLFNFTGAELRPIKKIAKHYQKSIITSRGEFAGICMPLKKATLDNDLLWIRKTVDALVRFGQRRPSFKNNYFRVSGK
jgi:hypothetical protein